MLETDKRRAIFLLHQEGMTVSEVARRLTVSRNTVQTIIKQQGCMPQTVRTDKQRIDEELLRRLYAECAGRIQRMHEKLMEEEHIQVKYSTLTRMLRELGIGRETKTRCAQVPDEAGLEMQHDTSLYRVKLAGIEGKLIASLIYLRYSKRRYLKFYRAFDRFKMKCFIHEALMFWGYSAKQCIIDNTNLARLRGTGRNALITPEMESFSKNYGFCFRCHEINHPNRKAGEERSFWTVETNFLPGRTFDSLEDINLQAREWSTVRLENRAQGKGGLIPAKAFEHESRFLIKLAAELPAPYKLHDRGTDQYGYIAFEGNFYWVPGTARDDVRVLQYSNCLKIYRAREFLAEYPLPADGVKNKLFTPAGLPLPRYKPKYRKAPTQEEEKQLRSIAQSVSSYLDFSLNSKGTRRHEFLRQLLTLSRRMTPALFIKSIERSHTYQITSIETIESIAKMHLLEGAQILPFAEVDDALQEREAFKEGEFTDLPDLSIYQDIVQQDIEQQVDQQNQQNLDEIDDEQDPTE